MPALCYAASAHPDDKKLDATTAFRSSSISNAIAVTNCNEIIERACHIKNSSLGNADGELNIIYIYLITTSVWNLVTLVVVQGICWYWSFTNVIERLYLLGFLSVVS